MSEDGFSDCFDEPNIEIHIKTLMGTTFDIKISSTDTVGDIKKKIYRVEGIPVYQQNLLFRAEELKDSFRLCDLGITNGSTLTLVSAMRGGPISTRRLSVSCEHHFLKELKELLENTRDEITPGSKVSVLVFKEGDIINLLRVIENEDGSYSPYSENPISPPSKPSRRDTVEAFERLVEDTEMSSKMAMVRKKLEELNMKRQNRNRQSEPRGTKTNQKDRGNAALNVMDDRDKKSFSYRFLEECSGELLDNMDLTIFEKSLGEENQLESEESALKDKHRTKPKVLQSLPIPKTNSKSLYSERKGSYSHTRQNYARIAKRRESRLFEKAERNPGLYTTYSRDRNVGRDEWEKSSLTYSEMMPNLLRNSSMLPTSDDEPNRLPATDDCSENPYLLEGLHSNRLPDLSILDKEDFLTGTTGDTPSSADNTNSFLRIHMPNNTSENAGTSSRLLPDLSTRLESRRFGPLIPDTTSNHTLLSTNLESSKFPALDQPGFPNKLPQSSYSSSLASTSKQLQTSSASLETTTLGSGSRGESPVLGGGAVEEMGAKLAEQLHLLDDENNGDVYGESLSVSARNRVHLTRLVLSSEGAERPKSSPDSIELEEHAQDIWEIREPASERLKHSATCKVGLLKRRPGLEYNYDSLENSQANLKPELGNLGNYSKSSTEFGVCSGATNFYMPQYLSAPSAIPPQYAPKQHPNYCDLIFRNEPRSPLYSRRNKKENLESTSSNVEEDCSSIQRLKNDDNLFGPKEQLVDDFYGYYNLNCAADLLEREVESKVEIKLPPVIKKKSRCNECNKRLNITNIYNCRCGRIFCSQHRYSEVHRCTYDYKTEGRKILEQQNPLVTGQKVQRF